MSPDEVRQRIGEAMSPGHFFVGPATTLEWEHRSAEEVSWEAFRGRLLDPAHTRQRRTFESWNIYLVENAERSAEPLLSVKWDAAAGEIHVVRAILSYAHEAYDAGGNVILTREVRKWLRELVGTIPIAEFASGDELGQELACRLFQAVVGTSRLPLTSVEAPLPAFTFGELAYFSGRAARELMRSWRELLTRPGPVSLRHIPKLLEAVLRAVPAAEISAVARHFTQEKADPQLVLVSLRRLFNEVSLSPFTNLTEKVFALARLLAEHVGQHAQLGDYLLGPQLRQLGRHLTAYDLMLFHHSGANYPDALLLDELLSEYLALIERELGLFVGDDGNEADARRKRLRRRALRQAWLVRQRYRGHAVPDAPTSPGENARVLPAPHIRVPEEQLLQPHRRTKQVLAQDVVLNETARSVLQESVRDLQHPHELRELGMALYLDRPLGAFKAPGEPDQTPLLSYPAFSRSIAMQRLRLLGQDPSLLMEADLGLLQQALLALAVPGIPVAELRCASRLGVVSLADAAKAAGDFVVLRTTAESLNLFLACFDFASLAERFDMAELTDDSWLVLGEPVEATEEIFVTFREPGSLRKRLELSANPRAGYTVRAGVELPRSGLRVRRVWDDKGDELVEHDLTGEKLVLRPRWSTTS
jgi:hypothetical protein